MYNVTNRRFRICPFRTYGVNSNNSALKVKKEVVAVHTIKIYKARRIIFPPIFIFGINWRLTVKFHLEKRNISFSCWQSKHGSLVFRPVAKSLQRLSYHSSCSQVPHSPVLRADNRGRCRALRLTAERYVSRERVGYTQMVVALLIITSETTAASGVGKCKFSKLFLLGHRASPSGKNSRTSYRRVTKTSGRDVIFVWKKRQKTNFLSSYHRPSQQGGCSVQEALVT